MTIIIIDDDEAIVEVTRMLFEQAGWLVHTFYEFPGFSEIESLNPDVLLLDYWMSGLSGKELLLALQDHPQLSRVPRLVMSAMQKIESQLHGVEVSAVVKKPFDIDELLSTAETAGRNTAFSTSTK